MLSPTERLAAWILTGPLGHLYGGVADLVELLWISLSRRRKRRRPSDVTL